MTKTKLYDTIIGPVFPWRKAEVVSNQREFLLPKEIHDQSGMLAHLRDVLGELLDQINTDNEGELIAGLKDKVLDVLHQAAFSMIDQEAAKDVSLVQKIDGMKIELFILHTRSLLAIVKGLTTPRTPIPSDD
mgnify:CR=1 FL=1